MTGSTKLGFNERKDNEHKNGTEENGRQGQMAHDAAASKRAGSGRRDMAAVQLSGMRTRVLEPPAAGRVYGGNVRRQVMHDVRIEGGTVVNVLESGKEDGHDKF